MNILVTTLADGSIRLFKEAVGKDGKLFASNSKMTSALLKADEYVLTPLIYDKSYIDFLISYCKKNDIKAIISFTEFDIVVLVKNKELFKQNGIALLLSDESVIKICTDKWKCYNFLLSIGLKQPKTYIDKNLLKEDLQLGAISFPLIFKPRWGLGSIGLFQVDAFEEIDVIYGKIYNKFINSISKHQDEQNTGFCVLMQETIKGEEHGMDILNDLEGNYVTCVPKRKMNKGFGEKIVLSQIINDQKFEDVAKTISFNLKHISNIDVDCFLDETGEIVVIEINCRFGGQYPFSHFAGTRFQKQIIEWLEGKETSNEYISFKTGVIGYRDNPQVVRCY